LVQECGAKIDITNNAGSAILMNAVENEDVDPRVLEFLISKGVDLNQKRRSRTLRWSTIRFAARMWSRGKGGGLMGMLARGSGATALHHATMRGDMEIVELLLSQGADPSMKNDLGQGAAAMCKSFPELRGLLDKRERKMKLRGTKVKKTSVSEVLGKRISTATPIQHEMWLISLEDLLTLYGKGSRCRVMETHQELKRRDFLTSWCDVPSDSEIVFVSHEWLSWAHPDPQGHQLRVLCRVIERLKRGELDTDMEPFHTIMYTHKFTTNAKDWESMLKRTYFWVDWFSMPQPGAEKLRILVRRRWTC